MVVCYTLIEPYLAVASWLVLCKVSLSGLLVDTNCNLRGHYHSIAYQSNHPQFTRNTAINKLRFGSGQT